MRLDAEVRLGDDLCLSERAFLRDRRRKMKHAFAKLFNIDESEIDERDLPIVALAYSGGGKCSSTGSTLQRLLNRPLRISSHDKHDRLIGWGGKVWVTRLRDLRFWHFW